MGQFAASTYIWELHVLLLLGLLFAGLGTREIWSSYTPVGGLHGLWCYYCIWNYVHILRWLAAYDQCISWVHAGLLVCVFWYVLHDSFQLAPIGGFDELPRAILVWHIACILINLFVVVNAFLTVTDGLLDIYMFAWWNECTILNFHPQCELLLTYK